MILDVLIIGSGPAGLTCAIYTARAGHKTVVVAGENPGGQLVNTDVIENYPGFESIRGSELMMNMLTQAEGLGSQILYDTAGHVSNAGNIFEVSLASGEILKSRTVLIATGAKHKRLGVPGEADFTNKGVSWCATCDGPMYKNKKVAVVGGGNTAVMEALFLSNFAEKVYLVHRRDTLRAEKVMQDKLFANGRVECVWNSVVESIHGEKNLEYVNIRNTCSEEVTKLEVSGLFIAIGTAPTSEFVKGLVDVDSEGYILENQTRTRTEGLFVAGDVASNSLKQAVFAAGQGALASKQIEEYLSKRK